MIPNDRYANEKGSTPPILKIVYAHSIKSGPEASFSFGCGAQNLGGENSVPDGVVL